MRKKTDQVIKSGRSKMVESGRFENETWGALHKAWKGYVIAINKNEHHKIERYARIIQELQHDPIKVLCYTGLKIIANKESTERV